jgi:hypothetical protein
MLLKIFASENSNAQYVTDEGCAYLGKVVIQLPETEEKLKVDVKMIYGETELMVEAKDSRRIAELPVNKKNKSHPKSHKKIFRVATFSNVRSGAGNKQFFNIGSRSQNTIYR